MTKLEQLRKAIIMAIHKDCKTYEEAIKEEFGFGFEVEVKAKKETEYSWDDTYTVTALLNERTAVQMNNCLKEIRIDILKLFKNESDNFYLKLLGKPITLARVLQAFGDKLFREGYEDTVSFSG